MISTAELFKQYMEHLFAGKRCEARELIFAAHDRGRTGATLLKAVIWPAMEQIERLYRADDITRITAEMATRINRMLACQLGGVLARKPKCGKRMVITCGRGEMEELGTQMIADLFEAEGWSLWVLGSEVPNDEVLQFVGRIKPDILCIYGAHAQDVPVTRQLISLIREVGVCEEMQVLVVGGVFNRADGLAEEVRADLQAKDIHEVIRTVKDHPIRVPKPDVPEAGRRRKRKRRKVAVAAAGRGQASFKE